MSTGAEKRLRRLADRTTVADARGPLVTSGGTGLGLDGRTAALVRLGALVALGAPDTVYEREGRNAYAAGATAADVVDTLLALGPTVGLARLVAATPGLSLAVGYDIEAAFEGVEDREG